MSARDLPWRRPDATPWGIFVSEIMLQQTPVARVEPVWHEWMSRWPTPADLAADAPGEAVRAWGRLGYPRRALRLHAAAVAMTEHHAAPSRRPRPSCSPCRESAPTPPPRSPPSPSASAPPSSTPTCAACWPGSSAGEEYAAPSPTRAELTVAAGLVPVDAAEARTWSVAVMELGALVCSARSPRCSDCPVADLCAWQLAGRPAYQGPARKGQAWEGTDRQLRGALLAVLRASAAPGAALGARGVVRQRDPARTLPRLPGRGRAGRAPRRAAATGCPRRARRAEMSTPPGDQHGRVADEPGDARAPTPEPPTGAARRTGRRPTLAGEPPTHCGSGPRARGGSSAGAPWRVPGWPVAAARPAPAGPAPTRTRPAPARAAWRASSSCTSSTSWATPR